MINDWVMDKSPQQIKELGTQFCTNMDDDLLFTDKLKPIPLTEELLELNGWILLSNYFSDDYYSPGGDFSIDFAKGKLFIRMHGHSIEVKYVHILQHALRLCGLRELADNFKVE